MDMLTQLTEKIESLIQTKENLELEIMQLREELDKERQTKESVLSKVENLLIRVQEVDLD
jgi:cell division protein ZapB